jgi:hypothetical protein
MCDYSRDAEAARNAHRGDRVIVAQFGRARRFALEAEPGVAVRLEPGTALVFDEPVVAEPNFRILPAIKTRSRNGRYEVINLGRPDLDHDAIVFDTGIILSLQQISLGQRARVLADDHSSDGQTDLPQAKAA